MERVMIEQDGLILCTDVRIADDFWTRFCGLMGESGLNEGEGLLLMHCGSIHTCFMKFAIDVVYLDAEMRVLTIETVVPWKAGHYIRGAKHVLELSVGEGRKLEPGHKIMLISKHQGRGR